MNPPSLQIWISICLQMSSTNPHTGPLFSSIFDNSRKNKGQASFVAFAQRLCNHYNHTHAPAPHMWRVWAPDPTPSAPKQWKSMFMLRVKPFQRKIATDEISSNIKARVSVHGRAQCHAKWPRDSREFEHSAGIDPVSPSLQLSLIVEPYRDHIDLQRKTVHDSSHLATVNQFFACRIVVLGLPVLKLNFNARHDIPDCKHFRYMSIYVIAWDIDWSWNISLRTNFCLTLIEQLINIKKARTENLKIRTDLRDWVMGGWSVTQ